MTKQTKDSIRGTLERQAKIEKTIIKHPKGKDSKQQGSDPLRLNWKDVVVF